MVTVRYICGKCGYRWVKQYVCETVLVFERRIQTPDCPACRPEA
jgi:hypothetical protein